MARLCDHCGETITPEDAPVELSVSSRAAGKRWEVRAVGDFHQSCAPQVFSALRQVILWPAGRLPPGLARDAPADPTVSLARAD